MWQDLEEARPLVPSLGEGSEQSTFNFQALLDVEAEADLPACVARPRHVPAQGHCMLSLARSQGTLGLPEELWASVFSPALSFICQV